MGNYVYLLIDQDKNVLAIYDSENLANILKEPLEKKFNVTLTLERRSMNLSIDNVGIFK